MSHGLKWARFLCFDDKLVGGDNSCLMETLAREIMAESSELGMLVADCLT